MLLSGVWELMVEPCPPQRPLLNLPCILPSNQKFLLLRVWRESFNCFNYMWMRFVEETLLEQYSLILGVYKGTWLLFCCAFPAWCLMLCLWKTGPFSTTKSFWEVCVCVFCGHASVLQSIHQQSEKINWVIWISRPAFPLYAYRGSFCLFIGPVLLSSTLLGLTDKTVTNFGRWSS